MKAYAATIERHNGDSWVVEMPSLNWGFLHLERDGGRAALEAAIRSTIEEITVTRTSGWC